MPTTTNHPPRRATGPTTLAGKLKSSRNALTHGLTAKTFCLDNEESTILQT